MSRDVPCSSSIWKNLMDNSILDYSSYRCPSCFHPLIIYIPFRTVYCYPLPLAGPQRHFNCPPLNLLQLYFVFFEVSDLNYLSGIDLNGISDVDFTKPFHMDKIVLFCFLQLSSGAHFIKSLKKILPIFIFWLTILVFTLKLYLKKRKCS